MSKGYPGLPLPYRVALDEVLPQLASDPATLAIFLAGSFLRGEAGPTSDVDLYVVVDSRFRQRRQVVTSVGVLVEMFLNPVEEARRCFTTADYHAMHMVGFGHVIFSRDAELAESLQTEARQAYERGPGPLAGIDFVAARYSLIDRYEDALDALANDPNRADPALWRALDLAIALSYRLARRWPMKDKRLLADLEKWDPTLATLVNRFYRATSPSERREILEQALRHVLGPTDSLKIEPWESVPEDIQRIR